MRASGCRRSRWAQMLLATAAAAPLALTSRALANKWWVNSVTSGDWLTSTNWSATNGGAGGAGIPGASDQVFIQAADSTSRTISLASGSATIISLEVSNGGN